MSERISVSEYKRIAAQGKGKRESRHGKDRRIKTPLGNFDSAGEYKRFLFLLDCEKRGVIADLQRQVDFPFELNGVTISTYKADAVYRLLSSGQRVVEDYKGLKRDKLTGQEKAHTTEVFNLKKKMMRAFYGVEILIVTKASYWDPSAVPGGQ